VARLLVCVLTGDGARVGTPPGNDTESVDNPPLVERLGKPDSPVREERDILGVDSPPLSEVLGKPSDAVTELRDILGPVGIARDVLRSLRDPDNDSVRKLRDSVAELSDGIAELCIRVIRPELRDAPGKVTDALSAFDNELSWGKLADRAVSKGMMRQLTCAVGAVVCGSVGPLIVIEGVLRVGKLEIIELPVNEIPGAGLISRKDAVGKDVPLNVRSGKVIEPNEEIVGRVALREVPLNVRSGGMTEPNDEIVGTVTLGEVPLNVRSGKVIESKEENVG
jgi:hypothetical protein